VIYFGVVKLLPNLQDISKQYDNAIHNAIKRKDFGTAYSLQTELDMMLSGIITTKLIKSDPQ